MLATMETKSIYAPRIRHSHVFPHSRGNAAGQLRMTNLCGGIEKVPANMKCTPRVTSRGQLEVNILPFWYIVRDAFSKIRCLAGQKPVNRGRALRD